MKLILNKSQRKTGMTGKIAFALQARVQLSPEEQASLKRYKFSKEVLYSKDNITPSSYANASTWGGIGRNLAAAALNLVITVDDMVRGKTVECKSIVEMLDVEQTIKSSCEALKSLLQAASNFEGETVVEY